MPLSTIVETTEIGNETKITSRPNSFLKQLETGEEIVKTKKCGKSKKNKYSVSSSSSVKTKKAKMSRRESHL